MYTIEHCKQDNGFELDKKEVMSNCRLGRFVCEVYVMPIVVLDLDLTSLGLHLVGPVLDLGLVNLGLNLVGLVLDLGLVSLGLNLVGPVLNLVLVSLGLVT